jgi:hypothetical protein
MFVMLHIHLCTVEALLQSGMRQPARKHDSHWVWGPVAMSLVSMVPIRERGLADASCWGEFNYWLAATYSSYHLLSISICRPTTGTDVHGPCTFTAHDLKFKWPYHQRSESGITGRFCGGLQNLRDYWFLGLSTIWCRKEHDVSETGSVTSLHIPGRKVTPCGWR